MKCIINDVIKTGVSRNKKTEVIHRFLRMKHRINIDAKAIYLRINSMKMELKMNNDRMLA